MKRSLLVPILLATLAGAALAADPPAPGGLVVRDRPLDRGEAVELEWQPSPGAEAYRVFRAPGPEFTEFTSVGDTDKVTFTDSRVNRDVTYAWQVAPLVGETVGPRTAAVQGTPSADVFDASRYKSLIYLFVFSSLLLGWIWAASARLSFPWVAGLFAYGLLFAAVIASSDLPFYYALAPVLIPVVAVLIPILRGGSHIYIRPIAAIQAVEEAIGRATEMGKPILFVPGISVIEDVATLAALNILSPVAEKAAQYDSKLIVPNYDPIVFTVTQEVVKEAYLKAGRPDAYSDDNVFYLSARQFAYAAAVNGIMVREKPATNFFLGMFYAESLLLAETGNMTGAIQIAGTDAITQLPFFIVACDYTLIGEELYAAGAYMGGDPKLTGSLKGQDWSKAVAIVMLLGLTVGFLLWGVFQGPSGWPDWAAELPTTLFKVGR